MSDRRSQTIPPNPNAYTLAQWNGDPQYPSPYSNSASQYPAPSNPHPSLRNHHIMAQQSTSYDSLIAAQTMEYHTLDRTHPYSHDRQSSMSIPQHPYAAIDRHGAPIQQPSAANMHPNSSHPYTTPRTHAIPHSYATQQPYGTSQTIPHQTAMPMSQYPPQVAFSPSLEDLSQYPASPQRPFSCDMCALSFNRQHDLKRHRDTHTGEKPFLCSGGCGKTFTRKDALKRHQLVKRCGIDEGA
ncbi:unnamed protein product [Somion occarium]|uniref:C2H2-type domain-containing protein n=1 Tax=Somion occarium TaxID=3059160 RepID=A0ABP1DIH1_9APHY